MGKTKAETVETGLRIPVEIYEELKRMAQESERSLNAEIVFAIKRHTQTGRQMQKEQKQQQQAEKDTGD